jgi:phosphatidylglycerophosphate synthase
MASAVVAIAFSSSGATSTVQDWADDLAWFGLAALPLSMGVGILRYRLYEIDRIIAASFRQEYCPPAMLGRVTASMRFLAFGVIPLGVLLAGTPGTALGVRNGLRVILVIVAASSLFLLTPRIRTARNLPDAPARTERKSTPSSPLRSPEMS